MTIRHPRKDNPMSILCMLLCAFLWTPLFMAIPVTEQSPSAAGQWILQTAVTCAFYYGAFCIERKNAVIESEPPEKLPANSGITILKAGIISAYVSSNFHHIKGLLFRLLLCSLCLAVTIPLLRDRAGTRQLSLRRWPSWGFMVYCLFLISWRLS